MERGSTAADEMDVRVAMHDEANVGGEAAGGTRVAAVGVLHAVTQPVSTQLRTLLRQLPTLAAQKLID